MGYHSLAITIYPSYFSFSSLGQQSTSRLSALTVSVVGGSKALGPWSGTLHPAFSGPEPSFLSLHDDTEAHHTRWDSSVRVISPTQRPLHDNTPITRDKHPCLRGDSNQQSPQASGRRATSYTARPLGSAINNSCQLLQIFKRNMLVR